MTQPLLRKGEGQSKSKWAFTEPPFTLPIHLCLSLDGNYDGRRAVANLVITIQDINDDPPAFSPVSMRHQCILICRFIDSFMFSLVQSRSP